MHSFTVEYVDFWGNTQKAAVNATNKDHAANIVASRPWMYYASRILNAYINL